MKYDNALKQYFEKELPQLQKSENYWPIPNVPGFSQSKEQSYRANVDLKHYLHEKWHSLPEEDKLEWAKIIVADWGGVRGNHPKTIKKYVYEVNKMNPTTPIYGVASYSKVFSIVHIEKYAIYDARVAVSLNAIQFIYGVNEGLAFNYISGRNNTTGHSGKKIGFVYQEPFKVKSLVQNGWTRIKRDETYHMYLQTLRHCLKDFPQYRLYDLEMALFANAEHLCKIAMDKNKFNI